MITTDEDGKPKRVGRFGKRIFWQGKERDSTAKRRVLERESSCLRLGGS